MVGHSIFPIIFAGLLKPPASVGPLAITLVVGSSLIRFTIPASFGMYD